MCVRVGVSMCVCVCVWVGGRLIVHCGFESVAYAHESVYGLWSSEWHERASAMLMREGVDFAHENGMRVSIMPPSPPESTTRCSCVCVCVCVCMHVRANVAIAVKDLRDPHLKLL